jgi:hypothetical protein
MAGRSFPAESTAESRRAPRPATVFHRLIKSSIQFRQFVFGNYGEFTPGVASEFLKGGGRKPGSKAAASLAKQQQHNHNQKGLPYEP